MEPQNKKSKINDETYVDFRDILHAILKWWWMIAILVIVFSTAAYFYTKYTYRPIYTTSASMIVNSKQIKIDGSGQQVYTDNDVTLSRTIADSYAVIMTSDRMMELVAKDLGLNLPASTLRSMVVITPIVENTEILSIVVHSPEPQMAAKIANSIMKMAPNMISSTVEVGSIKVIDYAKIPSYPAPPQTASNTAAAGLLGLIIGVFLVFLIRFRDKGLKNTDDIKKIGFISLGGIPFVPMRLIDDKIIPPFINSDWVGFGFVESYKTLRTNLQYTSSLHEAQTLLIASALNQEGKTTIALNLAMVFAQKNSRVLVMDCDLRKPNIHRQLGVKVNINNSLSSVLMAEADYQDCIIHVEQLGIDILPNELIPPNPSELLESQNMQNLLARLAQEYDWIILDTPSAYLVTDAISLSKYADGVVMVVKQRCAAKDIVIATKSAFENVGVRILGCILNAIEYKEAGPGYKYQYHEKYYASYYPTQTAEFKVQVVLELLSEEGTLNEVAAKYQLTPQIISQWKDDFMNKASLVFEDSSEGPAKLKKARSFRG